MASLTLSSLPVFLSLRKLRVCQFHIRTTSRPRINICKIYLHHGLKRNPKGINVSVCNVHGFPDSQGWRGPTAHRVTVLHCPRGGASRARCVRSRHLQAYPLECLSGLVCFAFLAERVWYQGPPPGSGRTQEESNCTLWEFRCPEPSGRRGLRQGSSRG